MKYRRLHPEELENLRDDFVQFLAANSVTASDWEDIKKRQPETAGKLIELFSDIVWEKVLGNIRYLEGRTSDELRVTHFDQEKIRMIVIKIKDEQFDFTNPDHISKVAEGQLDLMSFDPEIFRGSRDYQHAREMEVFAAMEQGSRPCKEIFWRSILAMLPKEE